MGGLARKAAGFQLHTDKTTALRHEAQNLARQQNAHALATLSADEQDQLIDLMRRVSATVKRG